MFALFYPVLSSAADIRINFTSDIQYFMMFLQTELYISFTIKKLKKKEKDCDWYM